MHASINRRFVLFLIFGLCLQPYPVLADEDDAKQPHDQPGKVLLPVESSKKSTALAAVLGGVLGLGTGQLYANGRWTWKSTLFLGLDAASIGFLIWGIREEGERRKGISGGDTSLLALGPLLIFCAIRGWQGSDAQIAARDYNRRLDKEGEDLGFYYQHRSMTVARTFPKSRSFRLVKLKF